MATSMELLQQGERFRIIDPPSLPLKPEFPNRLKFCGIGLGMGLALGVVVAGAFEIMDDRIHDEKELQKLLPVAVIAEIPAIVRPEETETTPDVVGVGRGSVGFWYHFGGVGVQLFAGLAASTICTKPSTI